MFKRAYLISIIRNIVVLLIFLPQLTTYVASLINAVPNNERERMLAYIAETGDLSYLSSPVKSYKYLHYFVDEEGNPTQIFGDYMQECQPFMDLMKKFYFGVGYHGPLFNVLPDDADLAHRSIGNWFFSSKHVNGNEFHIIYNYSERTYRHIMREVDRATYICVAFASLISMLFAYFEIRPAIRAWREEKRFIAQTSHELRTPIAVISTAMEIFDTENSSIATKKNTEIVKIEVSFMKKIIDDLFFLSRTDMKQIKLNMEVFDISPVLLETFIAAEVLANAKSIHFEDFMPEEIFVNADSSMIRRLIAILLENAIDYTQPGGKVSMSIQKRADKVDITVSDTGIGISKKDIKLIFKRFYRVDETRSANKGNSGMGLAIATWIVARHHGKISVESTPGHGSSFTVTLRAV